ncbi:MAG TPA: hypothetical protein VFT22_00750 [Kofleriaceae bacterium]|nr:hypothetical protein [Kofleriaceae bacterium]
MRAALIAVVVLGCGGAPLREENTLSDSVRRFNDDVRWQRFAVAATAIPPRERSQFVEDMDERGSDLKITDYEVVRVDARGDREARVQVKLSWYLASEGTLRETHALQTWERHGKSWWMVDDVRLRGAQMPGLAEPRAAGLPEPSSPPDDAAAPPPGAR